MPSIAPKAHTRGEYSSDDWITPRGLLDRLGAFDLDPCASVRQPWPCAERSYTVREDGLRQEWRGSVYANPPYGRETARWLKRLCGYPDGVALIFARTETAMFFDFVWPAARLLLFLRGRLTFCYPGGGESAAFNSGGPSVLVAYGRPAAKRLESVADLGAVTVPLRGRRPAAAVSLF